VFIASVAYCGYFPLRQVPSGPPQAARLRHHVVDAIASRGSLIVGLFAAGVWAATTAERCCGIDPGRVVIDEVVGMLITLAFIRPGGRPRSPGLCSSEYSTSSSRIRQTSLNSCRRLGVMADDAMAAVCEHSLPLLMWFLPAWVR
jgi:phosphatidylglycerophosphatase A